MLIPSIDLQDGRIVQLVQGERLALETSDIDAWIERLTGQPKVQLIDLDAAKGVGTNGDLVARICRELPCRVGGGIRSVARARSTPWPRMILSTTRCVTNIGAIFSSGSVKLKCCRINAASSSITASSVRVTETLTGFM